MAVHSSIGPSAPLARFNPEELPGVQRIGGLVEVPGLLRELGADPRDVFTRVGLRPADFQNPEARTSYQDIVRLLGECASTTGREHFGLLAGARWRLAHLGILGELMRYAPTVGDALRIGTAYQWLNAAGGVPFLFEHARVAELGYGVYLSGLPDAEQIQELSVALLVQLVREFCGATWRPARAFLARSEPTDATPYERFFDAPLQFDAGFTAVQFPLRVLDRRLPDADPRKARQIRHHVAELAPEELVARLRRALRVMLAFGHTSANGLAARLAMHPRTLDRRLAASGTSYREVLDEVRFAVARQLVETTALPIGEIAGALGYAEASPFVRAFRRWSGTTPAAWRRSKSLRSFRRSRAV